MEVHALGQHGDAGAFKGSHERGLLQQFGQVAVETGSPAHGSFERQAIVLWNVRLGSEVGPACTARRSPTGRYAVHTQAHQTIDTRAPIVDFAGWVSVGVDDARGSTDTLEPYRLPHDHQLVVGSVGFAVDASGSAGGSNRRRRSRASTGGDGAGRVDDEQISRPRLV